jgi:polyhydroxybutyrate depolymerase
MTTMPARWRRSIGALLLCGAAHLQSLAQAATVELPPKGEVSSAQRRTLTHAGVQRSYLIQAAPNVARPPLVVLLHGGTQTAEQVWRQTSLPTIARQDGFIVVAPQGVGKHWNDGRGSTLDPRGPSSADDVGFLRALIREVIARDHADADAVFMVGASNGGFMTMRFACEAADLLHAGASALANLPRDDAAACKPAKPLPWLAINGTDDPLIPFAGQAEASAKLPALLSADASFAFWADQARCAATITTRREATIERRERAACAGGARSVQIVMHGGGHVWPGLPIESRLVQHVVGAPTLSLDTGTVVWEHFRSTLGPAR